MGDSETRNSNAKFLAIAGVMVLGIVALLAWVLFGRAQSPPPVTTSTTLPPVSTARITSSTTTAPPDEDSVLTRPVDLGGRRICSGALVRPDWVLVPLNQLEEREVLNYQYVARVFGKPKFFKATGITGFQPFDGRFLAALILDEPVPEAKPLPCQPTLVGPSTDGQVPVFSYLDAEGNGLLTSAGGTVSQSQRAASPSMPNTFEVHLDVPNVLAGAPFLINPTAPILAGVLWKKERSLYLSVDKICPAIRKGDQFKPDWTPVPLVDVPVPTPSAPTTTSTTTTTSGTGGHGPKEIPTVPSGPKTASSPPPGPGMKPGARGPKKDYAP